VRGRPLTYPAARRAASRPADLLAFLCSLDWQCIRTGGTCEYVASRRGGSLPKKDRKPKADQERSSSSALSRARPVSDQPAHDNLGEHRLLSIPSSEIVDVRALSLLDTDDDPMDGIETLTAQLQNFLDSLRADSEPAGTILSSSTAQRSDSTSPAAAWENDDRRVRCFPNGESMCVRFRPPVGGEHASKLIRLLAQPRRLLRRDLSVRAAPSASVGYCVADASGDSVVAVARSASHPDLASTASAARRARARPRSGRSRSAVGRVEARSPAGQPAFRQGVRTSTRGVDGSARVQRSFARGCPNAEHRRALSLGAGRCVTNASISGSSCCRSAT
jgi:hypothetical protein